MANIVDYVRLASKSFAEEPVNRLDGLVFSWLAYARIPEAIPAATTNEGEALASVCGERNLLALTAALHDSATSQKLLQAVAASPRFASAVACRSVDTWSREKEVQFSATTFVIPEGGGTFVAYRGTDDTLVGWKENFNMAFQVVPAQRAAAEYLEHVAAATRGPLYVGGHSKGGNLAVFAISTCKPETRSRIQRCFAYDAPGFTKEAQAGQPWTESEGLVERIIPEESIVGLLFQVPAQSATIVSSTNPGIMQHSPLSWVVEGGDFATARAVSYDSYRTNKRLNAWLGTLSSANRERFVDVLYKLVNATGEVTFSGLASSLNDGSLDLALRRLDGLPEEERSFFLEALEDLVATLLLGPAPVDSATQTPTERVAAAQDKMDDITARFESNLSKLDKYGL